VTFLLILEDYVLRDREQIISQAWLKGGAKMQQQEKDYNIFSSYRES
jgi:hypothetical protein